MREYLITPVPKPRMTQRDKWAKRPAVLRYFAFCDQVRAAGIELGEVVNVIFVMPMPKSWSQTSRNAMDGKPHRQKPDLDNLLKAVSDAALSEDKQIHTITAKKVWGEVGKIILY